MHGKEIRTTRTQRQRIRHQPYGTSGIQLRITQPYIVTTRQGLRVGVLRQYHSRQGNSTCSCKPHPHMSNLQRFSLKILQTTLTTTLHDKAGRRLWERPVQTHDQQITLTVHQYTRIASLISSVHGQTQLQPVPHTSHNNTTKEYRHYDEMPHEILEFETS